MASDDDFHFGRVVSGPQYHLAMSNRLTESGAQGDRP